MTSDADNADNTDNTKGGRRAARAQKKAVQREARTAGNRRESRQSTVRVPAFMSMVTAARPSREEAEREAAAEFDQAVAPSMERLKAAVPEASSPEEAWRAIESKLGQPVEDPEPDLPDHPLYSGDALVYYQLRRHYGQTSPAGSFRSGWKPGEGRGGLPPILGSG